MLSVVGYFKGIFPLFLFSLTEAPPHRVLMVNSKKGIHRNTHKAFTVNSAGGPAIAIAVLKNALKIKVSQKI